ncbi:MAG: hypothetical protein KF690_09005 [Bacteroidetes bacterium]|nr:hypothetical protein [Bacteroidota bacterium]
MKYLLPCLFLLGQVYAQQVFVARGAEEHLNVVWVVKNGNQDVGSLQRLILQTPGLVTEEMAPLVRVFSYTHTDGSRWQLVHLSTYADYAEARSTIELLKTAPEISRQLQQPECELFFITARNFQTAYRLRKIADYCTYYQQIRTE